MRRPVITSPSSFPWNPQEITSVFTDLDDTLTLHGQLPARALQGLYDLKKSGRYLGVVSGCSFGWGACLIRLLPIDLMIVENGAAYFLKEGSSVTLVEVGDRLRRPALLDEFKRLKKQFTEISLAQDEELRRFDCAIDIAQEKKLAPSLVVEILQQLSKAGFQARPSSIHINFWSGDFGKASTLKTVMAKKKLSEKNCLYVGDSLNDEPIFAEFSKTVGVANIRKHLQHMKTPPVWILSQEGGEGFFELSQAICRR